MTTMTEFIAQHGITATAERAERNPNMDDDKHPMDHWRVRLARPGKRLTVYFSMGTGHHGKAPEAADVLDCLASDAAGFENARSFEEWCDEYGYDTDSRKAHRTFKVIERQAQRLEKFIGADEYQALLFDTERL
jgi:hypothetical protein